MTILIRPYRETDRKALVELTVASFQGVSIDHNLDRRLGPVAGRDWRWRKGRDIEQDIDTPGSELAVAVDQESGDDGRIRHDGHRPRYPDRLDS